MSLGIERIAQENKQVDLVLFDLRADLLHSAEMPGQMLVDRKAGDLFDEPSGCACGIEFVPAQDPPIRNSEILHQVLLSIVCD